MHVSVHIHAMTHWEFKGHLAGVSCLLPSHDFSVLSSGQPIWWQAPSPLRHHMGPLTTISMQLLQNV